MRGEKGGGCSTPQVACAQRAAPSLLHPPLLPNTRTRPPPRPHPAAEIIKRRIAGLHQNTTICSVDITDVWEPTEEGLDRIETTRHVSVITITLSKVSVRSAAAPSVRCCGRLRLCVRAAAGVCAGGCGCVCGQLRLCVRAAAVVCAGGCGCVCGRLRVCVVALLTPPPPARPPAAQQEELDTSAPGYQPPLPESEVRPLQDEDHLAGEADGELGEEGEGRGRGGRGRGRGRCGVAGRAGGGGGTAAA